MKNLVLLLLVAVAVSGKPQLLRYPSVYGGFPGVFLGDNFGGYVTSHGAYSNFLPYGNALTATLTKAAAPEASKEADSAEIEDSSSESITLAAESPSITLKAAIPSPIPVESDSSSETSSSESIIREAESPSITLKSIPSPITLKSAIPSPITLKTLKPTTFPLQTIFPSPLTYGYPSVAPIAPVAPIVPVAPFQSLYHAQDELGQYSFSFAGGPYSRAETRNAFGVVRGSYNYVDSEGEVQTQHYVADSLGFRVAGTNLPVAPDAPQPPAALALPQPVQDTPEVAAAKAEFELAYKEAAAAATAAPDSRKKRSVVAAPGFYSPLRFSYGFSTPFHYPQPAIVPHHLPYAAAPLPALTGYTAANPGIPAITSYRAAAPAVVGSATLLKVENNPGHATSYRVD